MMRCWDCGVDLPPVHWEDMWGKPVCDDPAECVRRQERYQAEAEAER